MQTPDGQETLTDLLDEIPSELVREAFTHASWTKRRSDSYERLAYLGDAVLGLAISSHLYPLLAEYGVGRLTKVRAQAVSGAACAEVALDLDVPARLREHAPEEERGSGNVEKLIDSMRVMSSVVEAVIGAVYIGCGYDRVARPVVDAFADQIEDALTDPVDFKSVLQEQIARRGLVVEYRTIEQTGPAHDRHFTIAARVKGREIGRGKGRTKKLAEQEAAAKGLEDLAGGRG